MTGKEDTKLRRLETVLAAFGADPNRWPMEERIELRDMVDTDPTAQQLIHDAAALDAMLDLAPPPLPSPELAADILHVEPGSSWRQWCAILWPFGGIWQPIGGLAAAAALSVVLALTVPLPEVVEYFDDDIELEEQG